MGLVIIILVAVIIVLVIMTIALYIEYRLMLKEYYKLRFQLLYSGRRIKNDKNSFDH